MEHFVRVIFDEAVKLDEDLNESVFGNHQLLETADGRQVFHIALERHLSESESDEYAERLSNFMFEQGHKDFDIEISMDEDEQMKINEFFDQDNMQELKIGDQLPYNVVEDLCIYMRNNPNFYRKHLYPEMINVQEAVKGGGKYNKKNMLSVVERAIEMYVTEYDIPKRPEDLLTDGEKMECISTLLKNEVESLRTGDY
tara:strand:- start:1093 stop:1689 length:597 start_codon:yes stop_codon:yes gene_type:complete